MHNMRLKPKSAFIVIMLLFCFLFFSVPVSANGPVPGPQIVVYFDGKPENNIAFVDLLIPIAANSADYSEFNGENGGKFGISNDSQIALYDEDGFCSYTFHFKGASSGMGVQKSGYGESYSVRFETGAEDLEGKADRIKIAFLSTEGEILHITGPIQISGTSTGYFTGGIHIDPHTFEVTDNGHYTSPWLIILLSVRIIPRAAFSVLTEALTAYFFKIKPLRKVVWLNIITQILLTVFMATTSLSYRNSLIAGEIAVYLTEGAAMVHMYKSVKKERLITFVFAANTVSLSLGVFLNYLGVFRY